MLTQSDQPAFCSALLSHKEEGCQHFLSRNIEICFCLLLVCVSDHEPLKAGSGCFSYGLAQKKLSFRSNFVEPTLFAQLTSALDSQTLPSNNPSSRVLVDTSVQYTILELFWFRQPVLPSKTSSLGLLSRFLELVPAHDQGHPAQGPMLPHRHSDWEPCRHLRGERQQAMLPGGARPGHW